MYIRVSLKPNNMKKTSNQEVIEAIEIKIADLEYKQSHLYKFTKYATKDNINYNEFWDLKRRTEILEQMLEKFKSKRPNDPSGWSFHTSFTYAMLVVNIILLLMIANKLL